jgi:hypothetical protein
MLTRRLLLVTAGSVLAYGCAAPAPPSPPSPPTPPPPQNIIDDINAILSGLVTILPGLEFLPPDLLAKIEGLVGQAQQLVASLASAITSGNAGAVIQSFLDVVNQIVLALTGFGTMPAWLSTAIGAIQFLLPIIIAFLGVDTATERRGATPEGEARARMILYTLRVPSARSRALPRARG